MINFGSRGMRQAAFGLFVVVTISTIWFAFRTYASIHLLRSAYEAGAPETSAIRGWMTLNFVADTYHVAAPALTDRLGLPKETDLNASLKSVAEQSGLSPYQYIPRVQRAVAELGANVSSDRATEATGWLGALRDEALSALLTYGYPVLGLTLLLGAVGIPLPDGLATTVAGSLAAQGRMNWIAAGAIVVVASVVGDIVGYGIGRLISQEVLERHGRWLGYTRIRGARVQRLFTQWGAVTVFITRTFVSYLSSVASLLAGVSRFRLSKFLAIAVVGRVMWTAAYLGLGYVIGADLEAAAGFLTNVSSLLLSAVVLFLSGVIASGQIP